VTGPPGSPRSTTALIAARCCPAAAPGWGSGLIRVGWRWGVRLRLLGGRRDNSQKAKILKKVPFSLEFDAYEFCSDGLKKELEGPRAAFKEAQDRAIEAKKLAKKVRAARTYCSITLHAAFLSYISQSALPCLRRFSLHSGGQCSAFLCAGSFCAHYGIPARRTVTATLRRLSTHIAVSFVTLRLMCSACLGCSAFLPTGPGSLG
jgi:hypothetical protein